MKKKERLKSDDGSIDEVKVSNKLQDLINNCIKSKKNKVKSNVDELTFKDVDASLDSSPRDVKQESSIDEDNDLTSNYHDKPLDNSRVIFIGNLPLSIESKSDLIKALNIDHKIIKSVHFRSLPIDPKFAYNKKVGVIKRRFTDVKNSKNAYVTLTDEKYIDVLLNKNTCEVDGHHLFINDTSPTSFSKFSRKKTVFVGRLPPSTNEDELFNLFSNVSTVKGVRIIRDPVTLKSKGFGFVAFDTRIAVPEAINMFNNVEYKGYTLNVMKSLEESRAKEIKLKSSRGVKKSNRFKKSRK